MSDSSYTTNRGFAGYLEIKDTKEQRVRVQQSSSAEEDAVWIFCEHNEYEQKRIDSGAGQPWCPSPHLGVLDALEVAQALQQWADDHSVVAQLSAGQWADIVQLFEIGGQAWVDQDEDYGYMEEVAQEAITRIGAPNWPDTRLIRLTDDEMFAFSRLHEYGASAAAENINADENIVREQLTSILGSFSRSGHAVS